MRLLTFLANILALSVVAQAKLPSFTRGVYVLLADNTVWVKNSQGQDVSSTGDWQPVISSWIQQFNVVFFTFINHDMVIPPSFEHARQSVTFGPSTKIIYSIGGYSYSQDSNWKSTFANPQQLAASVAQWKCDGIDLDLEDPVGNDAGLAANIVAFSKELKRLRPDFIITQPVFGYPQILSESLITVQSWDSNGQSKNVADAVGLMTYQGTLSLSYVPNYDGTGCTQWFCALCDAAKSAYPCASVPVPNILAGLGGDATSNDVSTVCSYRQGGKSVGGYMVWYASADNGFQYSGGSQDARIGHTNWNQCNNDALIQ